MIQPFSGTAGTSIAYAVVAHVHVADEPAVSLPAELRYERTDPCAVRLAIGTMSSSTVDWVFARDLLTEGMVRPAGSGSILVTPRRAHQGDVVRIVVRSPAGSAVLDIAAPEVTAFLERAARVVPPGEEGLHLDLDRLVADLLADAG
ncbi:SsgA family sporulation/cell division regulator [Streptomyces sp. NPDC005576]|uniref:SsgA family sporulation/cell division regulator n=1 Tax=unclassified Streptomyces TaxID=2593676 RepID=UPI0033CAA3EA